jgi:hypothetical protein
MLSTFQRQYIEQLTQRPDFKQLCYDYLTCPHETERESTRNILFLTTDGKLHGHRVGRKRLVGTVSH